MTFIANAKKRLKSVPLFYEVNARWKAAGLHREKRRFDREYARKLAGKSIDTSRPAIERMVRERLAARGVTPQPKQAGELRLYCVGTYYEQENSGFLQGLGRLGDVVIFTNDQGKYGLRGSLSGKHEPEIAVANGRCLLEQVTAAHKENPIDALIGTMVVQNTPPHVLRAIQQLGIPVVNIAMDDRLPDHWRTIGGVRQGAIGLADVTDLVLHTTDEYVPRYVAEECPAIFWPFGSDPELFAPSAEKDHDVVFVGNNYGWRRKLIAAINAAGIDVAAFGLGFPNGHIAAERVAEVFARARIVLGYGYVAYSSKVTTLKLRDLDGPMSGSLYLTTYNPDLRKLFELGREIDTYETVAECVRKIRLYLDRPEERERIAAAGRARALREHTWDARLREAFEVTGVLEPSPLITHYSSLITQI
jgi:spore maturation protein CgeB